MRILDGATRAGCIALLLVAMGPSLARGQGLRVGAGAFGGVAIPAGSTGQSYDTGGIAGVGAAIARRGSSPGFRAEASYVRLSSPEYTGVVFPAVKIIAVLGSVTYPLRDAVVGPYLLAGAGVAFSHHKLSYDEYRGSFAGQLGAGARLGRSGAAPFVELRYVRASTPVAATAYLALTAGFSVGRY